MTRNASIELYRVVLMFGICLLHAIGFGGHGIPWGCNMLSSCVVGFVFISGWFGVRFSWWKIVKLYGVGVYAAMVMWGALLVTGRADATMAFAKAYNQFVHGFWFLHAYAFMMCLAPLVNTCVDRVEGTSGLGKFRPLIGNPGVGVIIPLLVLVWGWGFGLTLPWLDTHLPKTNGLDAYGGMTLTAIYAAARICRKCRIDEWIRTRWLLLALPILCVLTGIGFGDYNSPFAFALAGVCFLMISRLTIPALMGKLVLALSPSMFAVYLIHTNEIGLNAFKPLEEHLIGGGSPVVVAWVGSALAVFVCACLLDFPRRAFVAGVKWLK